MKLLDLIYIKRFNPKSDFDGDFDGGSYTIKFNFSEDHSIHEKIEYTLKPGDYEELIEGMEYLIKVLRNT